MESAFPGEIYLLTIYVLYTVKKDGSSVKESRISYWPENSYLRINNIEKKCGGGRINRIKQVYYLWINNEIDKG